MIITHENVRRFNLNRQISLILEIKILIRYVERKKKLRKRMKFY